MLMDGKAILTDIRPAGFEDDAEASGASLGASGCAPVPMRHHRKQSSVRQTPTMRALRPSYSLLRIHSILACQFRARTLCGSINSRSNQSITPYAVHALKSKHGKTYKSFLHWCDCVHKTRPGQFHKFYISLASLLTSCCYILLYENHTRRLEFNELPKELP